MEFKLANMRDARHEDFETRERNGFGSHDLNLGNISKYGNDRRFHRVPGGWVVESFGKKYGYNDSRYPACSVFIPFPEKYVLDESEE